MGAHTVYKQWFQSVTGAAAAYTNADGFFLLASWAPLVTKEDFPDPALYDRIMPQVGPALGDRFNRPYQRFAPHGLIERIVQSQPDIQGANGLAMQIALNIGFSRSARRS